jgi:hypothetical protein
MIGAARRAVAGLALASVAGLAPTTRAADGALPEEGRIVRIAAGPTYLHETWHASDRSADAVHTGWGPALDVTVGEFVRPRVVLAGSLHLAGIFNRNETTAGVTYALDDTIHFVDTFVALLDLYPKPRGFHGGGGLGITAVTEVDTHMGSTETSFGLAGEAHVGYERFVSRRWSVGGLVRLSLFHYLTDTPPPAASSTGVLTTLLASCTYH